MTDTETPNIYSKVFYTYPQMGKDGNDNPIFDLTKAVPSKFLKFEGKPVLDKNPNGSNQTGLYKSLNHDGTINNISRFENKANYLIVPANYSIQEAVRTAEDIKAKVKSGNHSVPVIGGLESYGVTMAEKFLPGHSQDLQRSQRWGVPEKEVDPAFTDAASWHFGFVAGVANYPTFWAKIGGGLLNSGEYTSASVWAVITHRKSNHEIPYRDGMRKGDSINFDAGVAAAKSLRQKDLTNFYGMILSLGKGQQAALAPIARRPVQKNGVRGWRDEGVGEQRAKISWDVKPDFVNVSMARLRTGAVSLTNSAPAVFNPEAAASSLRAVRRLTARIDPFEHFRKNAATAPPWHGRLFSGFSNGAFKTGAYKTIGAAMLPRLGLSRSSVLAPHGAARVSYAPMPNKLFRGKASDDGRRRLQINGGLAPRQARKLTVASGSEAELPRPGIDKNYDNKQADEYKQTRKGSSEWDLADEQTLRQALERLLSRQARLPPSGAAGFDPRLSPAWAGLKLPG